VEISDILHKDEGIQGDFKQLQSAFNFYLSEKYRGARKFGFIHATPLIVSGDFREFYNTLMSVVKRVALSFDEPSIRDVFKIPDELRAILQNCSPEYSMGTLRPDFLVGQDENFFINEINARFPTNGYFISHGASYAISRMNRWRKKGIGQLEEISEIPLLFSRRLGQNVVVLKRSEPNWDISLFEEYIKSQEGSVEYFQEFCKNPEKGVVIELKQREIPEFFNGVDINEFQKQRHINDFRTILVAHDKRLLSILSDENILRNYASTEERKIIMPHIPFTKVINDSGDIDDLKDRGEWVLKHALKGKSKNVYIGREMSEDAWERACLLAQGGNFVAQRYVKQKEFSIYVPHLGLTKMNLEGMLLGMDGQFISQGNYRGKINDTTRLWDGILSIPPSRASKNFYTEKIV